MPTLRPSTYFLQDAIRRGLAAIVARLDREAAWRPFFFLHLRPQPRLEHQIWDLGDMCGRYVDAFILGRQVTGCDAYREEEQALRSLLHQGCDPYANPFMAGRMLLAFVDEFLQDPGRETRQRVEDLVALIRSKMTFENDYAYYFKAPAGWTSMSQPVFGDFAPYPTYPLGGVVLALARYLQEADSPAGADLIQRLVRFSLDHSGVFDPEGRFQGHTHSGGILTAAAGILRWAILQGDQPTIARMKNAFDWMLRFSSSWGWVPDGLGKDQASCETCAITDAIHLGLLLARHVDPAYYDIIERFARNQLLENQYLRPDLALPAEDHTQREAAARALLGSWASWSLPNSLDNALSGVEGCCLGAGIRGCFLVWDNSLVERDGQVLVNMAFSRNSPWVEVVSHLPYQGRLEIFVHQALPVLRVRLPPETPPGQTRVAVNGQLRPQIQARDHYLECNRLNRGDRISIEYPLPEKDVTEEVSGNRYAVRWRGATVVGIQPRGRRYPLFERDWLKPGEPPVGECLYQRQAGGPVHW
jgi:hypothetical protein